jgi:hypothetical protein
MGGTPVAMLFASTKLMLMNLGDAGPPWGYAAHPASEPGEGGGTTRVGDSLLVRSNEAVAEAERLTGAGGYEGAWSLLEQTAGELREGAPGSGRPEEVMDVVHSLQDLAQKVRATAEDARP